MERKYIYLHLCKWFVCLQAMWPDAWMELWLWAVDSSPAWKTQPAILTGCMKSANSSFTQLPLSTQRWVCHSVPPSTQLSLRAPHLRVIVLLCRVKRLWRRVSSASRRESRQRFSKPFAAATSSRGWLRRFVWTQSEKLARWSSLVLCSSGFCLDKGARRVLHQPWHLQCGPN